MTHNGPRECARNWQNCSPVGVDQIAPYRTILRLRTFLARWHAGFIIPVERTHHADAREHCRAAESGDQHQRLDRGLPFRRVMLALWQLGNERCGIAERDQRVGQRDGIVKGALSASIAHLAATACR